MSDTTTRQRYQVRSFDAPACDGGGVKHHVVDAWTGNTVSEHGGFLFTRDLDQAQQWADKLNQNWGPCLESH